MGSVIHVHEARWKKPRPKQTSYADLKLKYLHLRIENSGLQEVAKELLAENRTLKARLAALGY